MNKPGDKWPFVGRKMAAMDQARRLLRRQLRAAREIGGHESMADLVAAIQPFRQIKKTKLYGFEQGRGPLPQKSELWAIAMACGLEYDWFVNELSSIVTEAAQTQMERSLEVETRRARNSGDSSEEGSGAQGGPR